MPWDLRTQPRQLSDIVELVKCWSPSFLSFFVDAKDPPSPSRYEGADFAMEVYSRLSETSFKQTL
jgi:hypothetical protein